MVSVDESKRVITIAALGELADDLLEHLEAIADPDERRQHMVDHLAGAIDAHCVLLQRALCVHCGNDVPLIYVEKWDDWLHNGELTCIAGRARDIMGIDPATAHNLKDGEPHASSLF